MAKLTREELRIIEQTKQQAPDGGEQNTHGKWTAVRSLIFFTVIFAVFVFAAFLVIGLITR